MNVVRKFLLFASLAVNKGCENSVPCNQYSLIEQSPITLTVVLESFVESQGLQVIFKSVNKCLPSILKKYL